MSVVQLRPYQLEGIRKTQEVWSRGVRSALRVGATGTGKTVEFVEQVRIARAQGHRSLIIVDSDELVGQTVKKIQDILNFMPDIEKAEMLATLNPDFAAPAVVATIQTLRSIGQDGRMRCQRFPQNFFGRIFADEAHLTITATTIDVINYFTDPDANPDGRLCGYTATPERGDGASLAQLYDEVASKYEIIDAIGDGFLVPVFGKVVRVENVEVSKIKHTDGQDFTNDQVAEVMSSQGAIVEQASGLLRLCDGITIVFCPNVRHAELLTARLNDKHPDCAAVVSGKTPKAERNEIIAKFRKGEIKYLCNCMVLTKGFDCDEIRYVAVCRFTKSWSLFCLDGQTEILTRDGWKGQDDICDSDQIAQFCTQTDEISWSPLKGYIQRSREPRERMISHCTRQLDWRVTDQHRMVYKTRHGRNRSWSGWTVGTAMQMVQAPDLIQIPCAGVEKADGVPLTDDELRFIGWVMTDGTINKTTGGICISQSVNQPWGSDIDKCLAGCGFKYTKKRVVRNTQYSNHSEMNLWTVSKGAPRGRDKHLRGWGDLEPYLSKDFSPELDQVTKHQLDVLLEAMHLGDGAKQLGQSWQRRSYHISSGNKLFADRLQSLCVRRGYACNIAQGDWNKNPIYIIHIKPRASRSIRPRANDGRSVPAVEREFIDESVWCVETEKGTIVTRRNGKVAIMGNCQMVGRGTRPLDGILNGIDSAEERRAAIASSDKPRMTVLSFVGREGPMNLMGPTDALAGHMDPPEVSERAQELMEEQDDLDAIDALEQAREEIEKQKQRRLDNATMLYDGGDVETEEADLFDRAQFNLAIAKKVDIPPRHQLAFLHQYGFTKKEVATWSGTKVKEVIKWAQERHAVNLCTRAQARQIKRLYPNIGKQERLGMSKGEAGKLLGMAAGRRR